MQDYRGMGGEKRSKEYLNSDLRDCDLCLKVHALFQIILIAPRNVKIVSNFGSWTTFRKELVGGVSRVKLCKDTEIKPREDRRWEHASYTCRIIGSS